MFTSVYEVFLVGILKVIIRHDYRNEIRKNWDKNCQLYMSTDF